MATCILHRVSLCNNHVGRLHAQALTLAALAGSALVEFYDHKSGAKAKRYEKHI